MPAIAKDRKTHRFAARVSVADKQLFQEAAALEGRSMAKFIITHARLVARQVVSQNTQIQLNADQSRRFVEALLAPPHKPTTALEQAIVRYRQQVTES